MRRVNIYLLLLISLQLSGKETAFGQKEKNIWYFGNMAGLDFNSGFPAVLHNSRMNVWEGSASIADRNTGALLFYTDGMTVWDRTQTAMPNGKGLFGHWSSSQSALIVPVPGDLNKYYIFTTYNEGYRDPPNKGLNYSVVDMCLRNGSGDVIVKNIHLLDNSTEKLTGVPHSDGKDFWIIAHTLNTNSWYVYFISENGVAPPVIISLGDKHYSNIEQNISSGGFVKASPNGKKLISSCEHSCTELFDFDASSGIISNVVTLLCSGSYGASFSPDNSKLYLGNDQYDLSSNIPSNIIASKTEVIPRTTYPDDQYQIEAMQIGPDKKIYASTFTQWLGRINDPDSLGSKCNFESTAIDLGTGVSRLGLPNFMDSYTDTGSIGGQPCSSEPVGSFTVFPNPSALSATATIYMPLSHISLDLYDVVGKKIMDIFSGDLSVEASQFEIDTHELISGSYYIRLESSGTVTSRKLVVIR